MEVKPGYTAPPMKAMQMQPLVYAQPAMPPAMAPAMPAPMMEKPAHHDIHLHASYQQTSIVLPQHKPVHTAAVAKPCHPYQSAGSILVLFILLVIISRGFSKC